MAASPQLLEKKTQADPARLDAIGRRSRWSSSLVRDSSDRRLASRASAGDRRAIAAIFERYQRELYGFCLGLLGEPQDAQDALQNTMVKVLRALPGEEREISLRPWLYRIAHNEAIELRRSERPTQALDGYLADGQTSVTERAEQREQLQWLLKDLADLPDRQRTVLVMRELSGLDFAEIGAALDTSGAVVRQSLYEARRNLEQMDHGRGMRCEAVARALSDADRRITRRRDIRAHLRNCADCRRFQDAIARREGVLSAISIPAAAAAGIGQTLLGGTSGGGTIAALTGSAVKTVGTYGALKAAGTLAAVAVLGTAAIQGELKGTPPDRSPQPAHSQAVEDSSRSALSRRAKAVPPASLGNPSHRFSPPAAEPPAALPNVEVAHRRPHFLPVARGFAPEAPARPVDPTRQTEYVAAPPTTDIETEPTSENGSEGPPKPEKGRPSEPERGSPKAVKTKKNPDRGQQPAKEPKPPSEPGKKEKPESPGQTKTPPGQAKKQANAEGPTPPPALPAPVESEPAPVDAEAAQPAVGPESNGKAKGHEKQSETGSGQD